MLNNIIKKKVNCGSSNKHHKTVLTIKTKNLRTIKLFVKISLVILTSNLSYFFLNSFNSFEIILKSNIKKGRVNGFFIKRYVKITHYCYYFSIIKNICNF